MIIYLLLRLYYLVWPMGVCSAVCIDEVALAPVRRDVRFNPVRAPTTIVAVTWS